jgi:hypothetical protein
MQRVTRAADQPDFDKALGDASWLPDLAAIEAYEIGVLRGKPRRVALALDECGVDRFRARSLK